MEIERQAVERYARVIEALGRSGEEDDRVLAIKLREFLRGESLERAEGNKRVDQSGRERS
jgi:hypothetical protein